MGHVNCHHFIVRKPSNAIGCGLAVYPDGHIESSWWLTAGMFEGFRMEHVRHGADIIATTEDSGLIWNGFSVKLLDEKPAE